MRHLDTNDWLMMNGMIYKIYTMEDEKKMRQDFLEQLKLLIDFDAADFYLSSHGIQPGAALRRQKHGVPGDGSRRR